MADNKDSLNRGQVLGDEELRSWLEDYIKKHPHLTTAVLSRSQNIGINRSALDSYLAGTYFLPKSQGGQGINPSASKIENLIRAYRERVEGTVRHGYANTFVETTTWKQLRHACSIAIRENVIVVVYGKPGIGKSRGLMEYSVKEMTSQPILILCSRNITANYFVKQLAQTLNLKEGSSIAESEDLIAEKLIGSPRALFVDQANFLNERSLGSVCHIWEKARIPVALVGTKALYDLFMRSRMIEEVRAQLASRVAVHYLLPELNLSEVKGIVERGMGTEATDEIIAQIYNITGGIHRHVDMIIPRFLDLKERNIDRLANGEVKKKDLVSAAGARLMIGR